MQNEPDDFVTATGEQHSVKESVALSSKELGTAIRWEGEGVNEKCINIANEKIIVAMDPRYFFYTEVETLLSGRSKKIPVPCVLRFYINILIYQLQGLYSL